MNLLILLSIFIVINILITSSQSQSSNIQNNQIVKLIIKSYIQELMNNPMINENELKERLSKINEHIENHPALHQQYLWVGSSPPPSNYNPDYHILEYDNDSPSSSASSFLFNNETSISMLMDNYDKYQQQKQQQQHPRKQQQHQRKSPILPLLKVKRKKNSEKQLPSEEICETKEKWEQIIDTHDLFDNKVKVIQEKDMQQFVFTYRCAKNHGKCLGISPLFESECTERFGWMYMYYRTINKDDNGDGDNQNAQWGFVNAPHHCACKLKPKLFNNNNNNHHNHKIKNEEIILPNDVV